MARLLMKSKVQDWTPPQGNIKLRVGRRMSGVSLSHMDVRTPGSSNSQDFLLRGLGRMVSIKLKDMFVSGVQPC